MANEGRIARTHRTQREISTGENMAVMTEDDLEVPQENDPAGRTDEELDELEAEYKKSQAGEIVGAEKPADQDDSGSFTSLGKKQEEKKDFDLTEEGAVVYLPDDTEEEFTFKNLSNGENLEAEVERRKLLGGAILPPIVAGDGSRVDDPMNNIALMMAILKRCVVTPKNFLSEQISGFDPDYLSYLVPVYRAYLAFRERELEAARKKSKKSGSKFAF